MSIRIKHCVETEFLDLFRADLAATADSVELLSPFVSPYRSSDYHAVLIALSTRSVSVRAYVRPREEQPESLRSMYPEAIRNLELRGVQIRKRPGMHEKVAVLDGRILWHGSLNILSHNDSRESMLRFESPELVQEILCDLGIEGTNPDASAGHAIGQPMPGLAFPTCAVCNGPMRLFENAGVWICNDSPRCSGVRSIGSVETEAQAAAVTAARLAPLELNCPICDAPMVIAGILFPQISCPSVGCGFRLEPRLSAGMLRILSRRQVA